MKTIISTVVLVAAPKVFTLFMAGGGIKPGMTYGAPDDYCYNITENPVHVHALPTFYRAGQLKGEADAS